MAASSAAFKELKDHSIVVFLHSRDDKAYANVSPRVLADLHSPRMGKTIPQAVVTDPTGRTTYAALNYGELKDSKVYRTVKRDVKDYLKGEKTPPTPIQTKTRAKRHPQTPQTDQGQPADRRPETGDR